MSHPAPASFTTGPWTVHPTLKTLSRDGAETRVGHKVMAVLVCLVESSGELVTKDQLVERAWDGAFTTDEAVATVVYELRKALGDDARQPQFVETIRKGGYRWLAEIAPLTTTTLATTTRRPTSRRGVSAFAAGVALTLVGVFAWVPRNSGEPARTEQPIQSLAVLSLTPFEDQCSSDPFADRLTTLLIDELELVSSVEVVPGVALGLDGNRRALPAVWAADAVVEGAVVRSTDRLWVSVQLIDNRSGKTLWGSAYDRRLGDLEVLERELSYEIARQIDRHASG